MQFILGFIAAVLFFYLVRMWIRGVAPKDKKWLYRLVVVLVLGVTLLVVLTGRLHFLVALIAGVLPFIKQLPKAFRVFRSLNALKGLFTDTEGGRRISTRLLQMQWLEEKGLLDGVVRQGTLRGRALSELKEQDLASLYQFARANDAESIPLLEAYCERRWGNDWRTTLGMDSAEQPARPNDEGEMTLAQAYDILNLEPGASRQEVLAAHRQMMQKVHPDRGGSNFLAAQVNQAKDLLLKHR